MDSSDSQDAKALSPREVKPFGRVTERRDLHSEKASGPIVFRVSGNSTEDREVHDWNVE